MVFRMSGGRTDDEDGTGAGSDRNGRALPGRGLMVQYGIISYHTLTGRQTVVLAREVEYKGELFKAGTYEVPVDGRYFSDLDRLHPL